MEEQAETKDAIRQLMRARRRALTPKERERASKVICARLINDDLISVAVDPLDGGGGWYDRLMANANGFKIGVAHDFQIVENLPREPHDIRLIRIVTDNLLSDKHVEYIQIADAVGDFIAESPAASAICY